MVDSGDSSSIGADNVAVAVNRPRNGIYRPGVIDRCIRAMLGEQARAFAREYDQCECA